MKAKLCVIGNGMVGQRLLEKLVALQAHQQFHIAVFCEEVRPAYDRVHLSEYFAGRTADDLAMVSLSFFKEHGIELHLGDKAIKIDRASKKVIASSGKEVEYDFLVLATGSYPFVPPIQGKDRDNCFVYRTIEDLEAIQMGGKLSRVGVVVGGGLLGLEAANALKQMGLETHVVEFAPQLMATQIDRLGGELLRTKIEALGVNVHTSKNTLRIDPGEQLVHKMVFADDTELECDLILFSAGIRPQDQLARESELAIGERGGIVINNQCQTSDPAIYAIGECALWEEKIFGLVAPGYQMAQVVSEQLMGVPTEFTGADMSTKLKLMGVDVASIGDAHARTPGALVYHYCDQPNQIYKRMVVSADNKQLLGAVLIGDTDDYGVLHQFYLNEMALPEFPDQLILPNRSGEVSAAFGVDALPASAQICSCHDVTKADIVSAVDQGICTLSEVKACTKAGTGCGGCAALTKQVLDNELSNRGVEICTDLCEHFPYTRQELYHLVRVGHIKSFQALIAQHGTGHGCEICKPAVASILASCWNEHILSGPNRGLQDTNDIFLGNMQKDGTYSIVPRVAGGEITPRKLIVLGEVAEEFGLYTKITGGQRVDLFGATVDQLPLIWRKLVDAGFETGHAYGKAVRTVKSCVGSTWCRYGVNDSVGLAIEIENRYKGLRAPHKLKFAVSGCTRECAEAQSKDIGVIATENGWNLYVCGNGGMKPRHADLFATALSKEQLIQYIDRLLMFYIRTADRLQRTSVWMESLEGGLAYLQEVIINDSLGLAAELETEMAHVIGTYECEWKATLNDTEKLKLFRTYINSDAPDNHIQFVKERDQIRPATQQEKRLAVVTL